MCLKGLIESTALIFSLTLLFLEFGKNSSVIGRCDLHRIGFRLLIPVRALPPWGHVKFKIRFSFITSCQKAMIY